MKTAMGSAAATPAVTVSQTCRRVGGWSAKQTTAAAAAVGMKRRAAG